MELRVVARPQEGSCRKGRTTRMTPLVHWDNCCAAAAHRCPFTTCGWQMRKSNWLRSCYHRIRTINRHPHQQYEIGVQHTLRWNIILYDFTCTFVTSIHARWIVERESGRRREISNLGMTVRWVPLNWLLGTTRKGNSTSDCNLFTSETLLVTLFFLNLRLHCKHSTSLFYWRLVAVYC